MSTGGNKTYRPDGLRRSVQGRVHIWDSGNIIADIGTETVYYIRVLTLIYAKSFCKFNSTARRDRKFIGGLSLFYIYVHRRKMPTS